MVKEVKCSRGKVAIVDDEDFERVAQYRWTAYQSKSGTWYAQRTACGPGGRRYNVSMHRFILQLTEEDLDVDHRNRNGLDNRKANLRFCHHYQNCANKVLPRPASGFRGVYFDRTRGKWEAQIFMHGKTKRIGRFSSPEEAALARDREAIRRYGDFTILNFPGLA